MAQRFARVEMHAAFVTTSVNHPTLVRMDAESVRIFLQKYDQYCREKTARARQLSVADSTTTEPIRPVDLKFCVASESLYSALSLGFIEGADDIHSLTDTVLRAYLESKAEESEHVVTLDSLDSLVRTELVIYMSDKSAVSRMETLFVSYHKMLRRNGLKWLLEKNQKVAVYHVLSAVKPKMLRDRLEKDLEFANYDCRTDFKKFMKHALHVSTAFQSVDTGPRSRKEKSKPDNNTRRGGNSEKSKATNTQTASSTTHTKSGRLLPPCPHELCKSKGLRHWIRDCENSTDTGKEAMRAAISAAKMQDGPSRSTRSQTSGSASQSSSTTKKNTVGLLANQKPKKNQTVHLDSPACPITLSDGLATKDGTGRCDDGSDDSLVSFRLAERAALMGIGKLNAIEPIGIQVTLKKGEVAQTFSFSRTWAIPRTVLHLASGQLALANITFLVADDELACEDLIIGLPVLQHLKVDTRTLLENKRAELDGSDCSQIGNPTTKNRGGVISRMMSARHERESYTDTAEELTVQAPDGRPRANFYGARTEVDPFPDPSLLDPIDQDQHGDIRTEVEKTKATARENGLQSSDANRLGDIVDQNINVFRTGLSSGPPAKLRPLRIVLTPEAKPVKVRLRNYSQEQTKFMEDMVDDLVRHGMPYPNPTSPWSCAPLLVPKQGPTRYRFTVDLRTVNKFTVKHQYPMPNIEHELGKLTTARFFGTFDMSHGYWQMELEEDSQVLQSFITPNGIYSPTRVLHGTTNAVTHLQPALAEALPSGLREKILVWLDDILLFAST